MSPKQFSQVAAIFLLILFVSVPVFGGEPIRFDFQTGNSTEKWSGLDQPGVSLENQTLKITRQSETGSLLVRTPIPVEQLRGKRLLVTAKIKAKNVAKPPQTYNGIKCMLQVVAPDGIEWLQKDNLQGTFDWQTIEFTPNISEKADEIFLVLGLEETSGTVWFENISIKVIGGKRKTPETKPTGPVYRGHSMERLRGAMIGTDVGEKDIRVLGGQWNANHIRWQLLWGGFPNGPADTATIEEYRKWLESEFQRLDNLLPVCEELGMLIVIDLHTPPGGRDKEANMPLFRKKELQKEFCRTWEVMAQRFKDRPAIWGYDLLNEPCEGTVTENCMNWQELAMEAAKRIRKIDQERTIIVEPAPWGSPESLDWFEPLEGIRNVVYSVHMYKPHKFTHQGVNEKSEPISYPGIVDGKFWDKKALIEALEPVFRFQNDYNVHIYLGEFSAIRWAPGDSAVNYLRDCIDIFEENGWDWAFHAFREWNGWSVEHGPDKNDHHPTETPTDRKLLLLKWYEKCQKVMKTAL